MTLGEVAPQGMLTGDRWLGRPLNPFPYTAEAPFNSYRRQHEPTSGGNWFRYSGSLTESDIRVFDLMPGLGTDQIRIKFYTSLMTASENTYAALSYTWNNSDGTDDDKIIMVRIVSISPSLLTWVLNMPSIYMSTN